MNFSDPGIFEKTMRAFSLLEGLLKVYPELIFKGGTSILLHQFPPARFSIDIDILLPEKDRASLLRNVQSIAESSGFKSAKEDERQSVIPKAHYKFRYDPFFGQREDAVLLDVVFCEQPYHKIIEKSLKMHPLILSDTNAIVKIPTVDGLVGDKMTAVSPKTIGLRLTEGRDMEYLKQIIDLGALFDIIDDIEDVRETFAKTCIIENDFRKTKHSQEEVLNDILEVAFRYSQWLLKGADNSFREIEDINKGFKRLANHLVKRISPDDLKAAFAKVAYIGKLILDPGASKIVKNIDLSVIDGVRFEGKYKILDSLKKRSVPAFFYWALAVGVKEKS
ncbi:MAG: nucleotidyl transferase AbiEii/AbiGii toxin family protein [Phycisphaerae bacterium]